MKSEIWNLTSANAPDERRIMAHGVEQPVARQMESAVQPVRISLSFVYSHHHTRELWSLIWIWRESFQAAVLSRCWGRDSDSRLTTTRHFFAVLNSLLDIAMLILVLNRLFRFLLGWNLLHRLDKDRYICMYIHTYATGERFWAKDERKESCFERLLQAQPQGRPENPLRRH